MKTITNLKTTKMLVILACLCLSAASYAQVVTYPQVPNVQGAQYSYALQVRESGTTAWNSVPLYNVPVVNGSAKNSTVGYFDTGGATDIQITFSTTVTSVDIGPASLNVTPTISGNTINFTIPGSQKFYVDINGNHYENCIHVIANPLEVNPPQEGDPGVIFIPAGTFVNETVSVPDGQTLYIQGGAGVKGISLSNTTNTKVRGRGVVYRASFDAIGLRYANNVSIDGVLDFNHGWGGGGGAGIRCGQSSNITITNTVSFSSKTWGDGYNIFSSENVTVDDVFIRTHDDAITFYGGGKSGFTGDCKNITLTNSVLLNDIAQSIHVGVYGDDFETEIRDINVSNIDICNWSQTPGRPAIYFTVGDEVRAANFHFEDIRIEDHVNTHLLNMALVNNGTYNYGPGREIDSIYFKNVTYTGGHDPGLTFSGWSDSRKVKNVFFEGLEINGKKITSPSDGNINISSYTENISFGLLPSPWSSSDIGAVGVAGDASLSNGTFTLEGSGADIWGTADEFRYAYQPLSGDGEIIAKVESLENTNEWAKAGVMIRETLDAGSKHAIMVMTPEHGAIFQRRPTTGGSSLHNGVGGYTAPYWVRLVRSGSTLTGYRSPDGSNWTQIGSETISMATDVYVGLAVTSHDDSTLATATFSNVSVQHKPSITSQLIARGETGTSFNYAITATNTPTSYDATGLPAGLSVDTGTGVISGTPTTSDISSVIISATNLYGTDTDTLALTIADPIPLPWETADIGSVATEGDAYLLNGMFTLEGSGSDIWGTADEFRYVYQPLSGDGEIIARVEDVEDTNDWAKAGVMIRETLDTGSKHAQMVITPNSGISFQNRTATGDTSSHTTVPGYSAPYWLRLVRSGDTLTGYRSPDGSDWTQIGSETIAMATDAYVGLVVTSHNDGTLCTGTFSNVSVQAGSSAKTTATIETMNIEEDSSDGPKVYPNPVSDAFYVKNANAGDVIFVYNNSGQLVLQDKIGQGDKKVEMGGLRPGLYFVKVIGDEAKATIKVIKN